MLDFEDPVGKTADRTFSRETGLDSKAIAKLNIDDFEIDQIEVAMTRAEEWARRIVHHTGLVEVEEALRAMQSGVYDLVLVDYAQCFPEEAGKTMEATIRRFSWEANVIAQKSNSAVVVFSQLRAEVETRGRKQFDNARWKDPESCDVDGYCPSGLADVAWAKALADQCKCLLYLWRPGRIARKVTGSSKYKDDKMKVIVGKSNFSGESTMVFGFSGATASLWDL